MGQVLDAKPILMLDHIPYDKTKGIFLHHLVKPSLARRGEFRREEESFCWVLSEDIDPSRLKHPLHREWIL
jgi:hypothetical protein